MMVIDRHRKGRSHRISLVFHPENEGASTFLLPYNFCVHKISMKSIDTSLVPFNSSVFKVHVLRMMCTSVYFVVEFVRSTKLKGDFNKSHSMCFYENTANNFGD